jgi:hypothetical protein
VNDPVEVKTRKMSYDIVFVSVLLAVIRASNSKPELYADEIAIVRARLVKRSAVRELLGVDGAGQMSRDRPVQADLRIDTALAGGADDGDRRQKVHRVSRGLPPRRT